MGEEGKAVDVSMALDTAPMASPGEAAAQAWTGSFWELPAGWAQGVLPHPAGVPSTRAVPKVSGQSCLMPLLVMWIKGLRHPQEICSRHQGGWG